MPLAQEPSLEQIKGVKRAPERKALIQELTGEVGNALKKFQELPKEEKKVLVGSAIGLITLIALLKTKEEEKPAAKKTSKELASLKTSVSKDTIKKELEEKKESTEEEPKFDELAETKKIKAMTAGERILYAIKLAREHYKTGGKHCGDWAERIYKSVGCVAESTIYVAKKRNKEGKMEWLYKGKDCGKHHASESDLAKIEPGAHLYYNVYHKTKKSPDKHGNHSAIFIRWIDENKKIAEVASYTSGQGNKSMIHNVNFKNQPVTRIANPEIKNPVNIALLNYKFKGMSANIKGTMTYELA